MNSRHHRDSTIITNVEYETLFFFSRADEASSVAIIRMTYEILFHICLHQHLLNSFIASHIQLYT